MKSISIHKIHTELLDRTSFSREDERIMFEECIESYYDKRFFSSCTVGMVLFEKIFFSRLHTLTYLPEDFESTTENDRQHMEYYMERERIMNDGEKPDKKHGMTFYEVTDELNNRNIISSEEKKILTIFTDYTEYLSNMVSLFDFMNKYLGKRLLIKVNTSFCLKKHTKR